MTIGRRCAAGCATWPDLAEYAICPRCGGPTSRYKGVTALAPKKARRLALIEAFERYYETEHVIDNEPLTPDQLAKCGL